MASLIKKNASSFMFVVMILFLIDVCFFDTVSPQSAVSYFGYFNRRFYCFLLLFIGLLDKTNRKLFLPIIGFLFLQLGFVNWRDARNSLNELKPLAALLTIPGFLKIFTQLKFENLVEIKSKFIQAATIFYFSLGVVGVLTFSPWITEFLRDHIAENSTYIGYMPDGFFRVFNLNLLFILYFPLIIGTELFFGGFLNKVLWILTVGLTYSRAIYLGFFGALSFLLIFHRKKFYNHYFVFLFMTFILAPLPLSPIRMFEDKISFFGGNKLAKEIYIKSDSDRKIQAACLITGIIDKPILGNGWGWGCSTFVRDQRFQYTYELYTLSIIAKIGLLGLLLNILFILFLRYYFEIFYFYQFLGLLIFHSIISSFNPTLMNHLTVISIAFFGAYLLKTQQMTKESLDVPLIGI